MALEEHVKDFVIYISLLLAMTIHPARKAQIALLVAENMQILAKYLHFSDVFLR